MIGLPYSVLHTRGGLLGDLERDLRLVPGALVAGRGSSVLPYGLQTPRLQALGVLPLLSEASPDALGIGLSTRKVRHPRGAPVGHRTLDFARN